MIGGFTMRFRFVALASALLALAASLVGAETIHLKNGEVLEGRIVRETETFLYLVQETGGIERPRLILKNEIEKIIRDDKGAPAEPTPGSQGQREEPEEAEPASPSRTDAQADSQARSSPGEPNAEAIRIAFLTLEGTVGLEMYSGALAESIELLEDDEPDIVVLRFDSGGGIAGEVKPLSDVIERKIKPNYRVVAWIKSAISAAAMTAVTCEEIYFTSEGNLGAATAYRPTRSGNEALTGRELQELIELMEKISYRGDRDPLIMRAMQTPTDLSCDIDKYGLVRWRNDLRGEHIVSTAGNTSILTFNSVDAVKYNFAQGVANSKEALAQQLGVSEWIEVGQDADRHQREFRETMAQAQTKVAELRGMIQVAMGNGQPARARRFLGELRGWARRAPPLEKYLGLTDELFRQIEEQIEEMTRGR